MDGPDTQFIGGWILQNRNESKVVSKTQWRSDKIIQSFLCGILLCADTWDVEMKKRFPVAIFPLMY